MRKIVYSVATSLDGYIAGPMGEADWIVVDPELDFASSMGRFDTILMGRRTFDTVQATSDAVSMPGFTTIVVSRTLRQEDHPSLCIIADDVGGALSRLRAASGKDIWLFGGGTLFGSLLDLGLVDIVEVGVMPVLLGNGIPLLPARSQRTTLKLVTSKAYEATGTVGLEYAIQH
jgi:dihydrofolate reductase